MKAQNRCISVRRIRLGRDFRRLPLGGHFGFLRVCSLRGPGELGRRPIRQGRRSPGCRDAALSLGGGGLGVTRNGLGSRSLRPTAALRLQSPMAASARRDPAEVNARPPGPLRPPPPSAGRLVASQRPRSRCPGREALAGGDPVSERRRDGVRERAEGEGPLGAET